MSAAVGAASSLGDGLSSYVVLFVIGFLVHEPWRWLGLALGSRLQANSELFVWVRAVSNALVAALVARLILYPAGELGQASLNLRLLSIAAGLAAFYLRGQHLLYGVGGGLLAFIVGEILGL